MKKNLALVLVLAVVMAVSVVAFAACGGTTYEGAYHYNSHNTEYGCKVKVTVSNNVITKVVLLTDEESGYVRTTTGWKPTDEGGYGMAEGDLGYTAAEAAYPEYLKTFEGKAVDEVKGWTVTISGVDGADANAVTPATANLKGATQSAARIIKAVQNALEQIPAAE